MNLLARNTDYAVRAMLYMVGKTPERVSTTELDEALGLPRPFMRKTLQTLQKAGYLASIKGKNGGFTLALSPEKIRLVDLMALFQGTVSMGECLFRKKVCGCAGSCPLRKELKQAEVLAVGHLRTVTLASLAKG